jgi:transcriptional regulator with GAF, ATPase, and Fis domain
MRHRENSGYLPWIFRTGRGHQRRVVRYARRCCQKAMDTLKPVVVDTRKPDQFVSVTTELATAEGMKALCGIPLANRGRVLGILSTGRTTETSFSPEDVDFLGRSSGQIAIAIENALAFQQVRYHFTSTRLSKGLSPSSCRTCLAHTKKGGRTLPPFQGADWTLCIKRRLSTAS